MLKDNYDFFKDYDREQAEYEARLPRCACCGEPIQDEEMYNIDGWYCEGCKDLYLEDICKNVADWMDEQKGGW